jgi:segregation and condensation protein A
MTDATAFTEDIPEDRGSDEPTLIVDVAGFEGPLDLLLTMARQQKVDLAKISILALADQYLAFVEHARRMRLELAADYLVMAAWLAYLKSRLLLPEPVAPEGLSAADMAKALALRLRRLDAIREAGALLFQRPQFGREVFGRGDPEPIAEIKRPMWSATLYDLISAYATERQRHALVEPSMTATAFASSLAASLELVREGVIEVQQAAAFAPIYMRKRRAAVPPPESALPAGSEEHHE